MTRPPTEPPAANGPAAWPRARPSRALAGAVAAMVGIGVASGAYMLRHRPWRPDAGEAARCAKGFDARAAAARRGTDAARLALATEAVAADCGPQAFAALGPADWQADEAVAWTLARFYDSHEADPAFRRAGASPDPAWTAELHLAWAKRSPRHAAALAALCASDGPALAADPALDGACAR